MIHALKIIPEYFVPVIERVKTFEVRKADRPYRVGDYLALNEFGASCYTGRCCMVRICYILTDQNMLAEGYVVLGIEPCAIYVDNGPVDPCTRGKAHISVYGGEDNV